MLLKIDTVRYILQRKHSMWTWELPDWLLECPRADYPVTCAPAWLAERSWLDRRFGWSTTWLHSHLVLNQAESWKTASCHHYREKESDVVLSWRAQKEIHLSAKISRHKALTCWSGIWVPRPIEDVCLLLSPEVAAWHLRRYTRQTSVHRTVKLKSNDSIKPMLRLALSKPAVFLNVCDGDACIRCSQK